jgi:hypothetical protein
MMTEIRKINVRRWSVTSQKPFETVVGTVEAAIGSPNMTKFAQEIDSAATYEEMEEVVQLACVKLV